MKNIVITGCTSGMGAEATYYLVKHTPSTVIGIGRNEEKLQNLLQRLEKEEKRGKFISIPFDITDIDNYNHLMNLISEHCSSIQVLINNAGVLVNKPFEKTTPHDFGHVMSTNFKAPFFLIQNLLPLFEKGAHIVNISSMGGVQGSVKFPGLSVYSASKAALAGLTECLAAELQPLGISVNAIAPGAVQTDMLNQAFPGFKAGITAQQMGEYIATFAITGHDFFNGKILPVSASTP